MKYLWSESRKKAMGMGEPERETQEGREEKQERG